MQQNPPPPTPAIAHLPRDPEMASAASHATADDPTSSTLFDFADFLDFNLEEVLNDISVPLMEPEADQSQPSESSGRARKRDPRLVCPNFLAGRIPCACPELDERLEEEEAEELGLPGKKRARLVRGGPARCQVPNCGVDITELKGYHKRHRVCLRCANANDVVLDGESKRYCQQCGKFHLLSDFDEGRRSCRRKLERHNNRRRGKPSGSKGGINKKDQIMLAADDVSGDDEAEKDGIFRSIQIDEREMLLKSDGNASTQCSAPDSQNPQSDSLASFAVSGVINIDAAHQNPKYQCPQSHREDKNNFSTMCPAGRISFKLYDWNPAEFPRRLRHQIFQWLDSMPVELEGYIRPGCTILTAFISMPKLMWLQLLEEPALCIKGLVASPQSMLSGRGTMLVYLNDLVFRVSKDANSVVKVKARDRAPKLHYVHPTCFEAGRPMEFVACGSDLLQPKFRFLISFAGRYLTYNISVSSPCCKKGNSNNVDHQLLRISVPKTDMDLYGPAFIEVENQSGLSNFIPIFVGEKETCAEMEILQQKFASQEQLLLPPGSACEIFASRQEKFSEFVLDVAWSLKKPVSENPLTSSHIQRFNNLLNYLIQKESSVVLDRVFFSLKSVIDNNLLAGISDADMRLLGKVMGTAESMLEKKLHEKAISVLPAMDGNVYSQRSLHDSRLLPATNKEQPNKACGRMLTRSSFLTSRPLMMALVAVGVCLGICTVLLHPQRVSQIVTTMRRGLFDRSRW